MNKSIRSFSKAIISAVILIGISVGGLTISLYILKEEAVKTHLKIAQLHVNTFAEQIYQTFNYIDLTTDGLISVLREENLKELDKQYKLMMSSSSYIRSINILSEDKIIISSSNSKNIGLEVDIDTYYPKPLFNQQIFRFGITKYGRDFYESKNETLDKTLSFLPLIKKVVTTNKVFYIAINLNSSYFTNRYIDSLNSYFATLQIIRLDGMLLYTSDEDEIAKKIQTNELLEVALNKSISSGIEQIEQKEFLSAYHLTDYYPLNISIKLDFEKSLADWENKRKQIILLTTILVSLIVFLIIVLISRKNKEKNKELEFHKKQLEEQKRFKTLFEQDIFLASVVNDDGSIDNINQIALEFLGLSYDDIKSEKFYNLECWKEKEKLWLKDIFLESKKQINFRREVKVFDSQKKEHTVEFILKSIEIDGHYKVFAIALDITEKKENEQQLRHAYVVYQNTHDGIMITDKDANIIDVNRSFIKSTGYSLSEIKGKNPRILKSGKTDESIYTKMWESIINKGYWNGELINKNKEGKLYDELLTVNSVVDEKGEVKNYIGIFTNVSKQKEQEKKLKEQEHLLFQQSKMAALGEMLENIAHQWRQPLSVISMSASGIMLKKQFNLLEDEYMENSLNSIVNNTKHLSKTIDDFRDFFKPNKEKSEAIVSDIIDRTLVIVSSKFQNRDIKVIKDVDDITINIFDNELVQVIMNILKNSQDILEDVKQEDRYIFIVAKKEDDKMVLKLKDSGGGVKEDIIEKVFEPYFTTKHQSQGTGIGLYMSEEIISKHMGGKLYVYNEEYTHNNKTYKGAVFTIEIPLS